MNVRRWLVFAFALAGCSTSTTGTGTGAVTCGQGTHAEGSVCTLDPAYAITNPQDLGDGGHWRCAQDGAASTAFALQLSDDGNGAYQPLIGGASVESFTWSEGDTADSIQLTSGTVSASDPSGVPFIELLSIAPSPAVEPTDATFTLVRAGNPSVQCEVVVGPLTVTAAADAGVLDAGAISNGCQPGYAPANGTCVPVADASK